MNGSETAPGSIKITVVGDGNTGKTCMFDNFNADVVVDDTKHNITLWDTAGQEDYERLRPLSYPHTKVFLLCFAVNSRASFENIVHKWAPELKHHCKDAKIVLVATKTDLRPTDNNSAADPTEFVSSREGKKLKSRIHAARYVECSAKTRHGLQEVFQEAVRSLGDHHGAGHGKPLARLCAIL
ncbi:unnamed protein product [Notodromas monacha]|uniref:Uncharacterized protein n=1 Tax=Notodromas monacha TaxID=399045 RepID=A0A7R9BVB8_9CRUS|nr:unnamed protein product [Notodromas monacha]CAG0922420.1 unnamed protein product [Notodromas monacha]